ncbi:hypothetical protein L1N85_23445 [Paenibacillus alkaliterrae]|uniref:hypothetical protein n=1 Tax=Paenibacillus alkaliterrae TaxID=320909 RepID=UPI001F42B133|nr:hypothetical protein [Paenibacillus alkaliterrae]MCF2941310.1 hypothetical protein [Paenibacillus alkaliterrae]
MAGVFIRRRLTKIIPAIGEEELRLKAGDVKTLAVYRQTQSSKINTFAPMDEQQLKQIIEAKDTLLILKIKVESDVSG